MIPITSKLPKPILLLAFLSAFSAPLSARDYKVEILIIENIIENRAYEPHNYEEPTAMPSNAETWQIEPTMLTEAAEAIENSNDYHLAHHFSWGQESLPYSQSAAFQVIEESVQGWVKVYATQLLFANIDIDYNGYRLSEKRRLKLNEKHFFDHPKFGILMQVSRLEEDNEQNMENLPAIN